MFNYKSAIIILFSAMLLGSCGSDSKSDITRLNWMLGKWEGMDDQGLRFTEHWVATGAGTFSCKGSVTAPNGDTIYKEVLKIEKLGNELFYVSTVPEKEGPVHYKIEVLTDNNVLFTNREFDFPQEVEYKLEKPNALSVQLRGIGKEDKNKKRLEQLTFQKME